MKISQYISIIIIACMLVSLSTSGLIYYQSNLITESQSELYNLILKKDSNNKLIEINKKIEEQKANQQKSLIALGCFVIFFTIKMLRWSCKKVIQPISKLTDMTTKASINPADFEVSGPVEVSKLSNEVSKYATALTNAKEFVLQESERSEFANLRFRNIMETAGDAIICTDSNGIILEMNQSFRELIGIEVDNNKIYNIIDFIPEYEINNFDDDNYCKLISIIEAEMFDINRDKIPVEISTSSFESNGRQLSTIIIRDITERAELTEKLLQAQKLESIGLLAAGIAHEINTPAQYIMDYNRFIKEGFDTISEFLKKVHDKKIDELESIANDLGLDFYEEEVPNAINGSLHGLEQISRIVKSVKGFTHPEKCDKTFFNINKIIQDTLNVSRNEWKYYTEVNLALDEHLPNIKCFPVRLNQVFLNLIINSVQAIQEKNKMNNSDNKGAINISTMQMRGDIVITVSDTGNGIPENIRHKVFDPFFTTKEVGVGTGQGLALAYDFIVKKHHGKIDVHSNEGKGTEFIITLPFEEPMAKAS